MEERTRWEVEFPQLILFLLKKFPKCHSSFLLSSVKQMIHSLKNKLNLTKWFRNVCERAKGQKQSRHAWGKPRWGEPLYQAPRLLVKGSQITVLVYAQTNLQRRSVQNRERAGGRKRDARPTELALWIRGARTEQSVNGTGTTHYPHRKRWGAWPRSKINFSWNSTQV